MIKQTNTREAVLEALLEILEKDTMSHLVINQMLKKYQFLDKQERSFMGRLTEGCLERKITLDYVIDSLSTVKTKKMKPVIRNLLRMGAYQILYMDGVPDSAACNEAVRLAEKKGFKNLKGFVNGVLRNIARKKESIEYPDRQKEPVLWLSVCYSMPAWIVRQWLKQYGREDTEKMLAAGFEDGKKKTSIRCCLSGNGEIKTAEEIKELLRAQKVTVEAAPYLPYACYISDYDKLDGLSVFTEGYIQIQDLSSMLVAEAAGMKQGDYVMDVCAAPGGKCLHAADKLCGTGIVDARDLSEYKTSLIEENKKRCRVSNLHIKVWDACVKEEEALGKADVLLADLPCSGLGVTGRKNDLKYNMTEEKQKSLIELQREILGTVWEYVKPGGTLIYSTCTVNRGENEENVKWFLEHFPFEAESLLHSLPKEMISSLSEKEREQASKGELLLRQGVHPTDGFFLARLKRKNDGK